MRASKSAGRLAAMISKAISDHELTEAEHQAILELAREDEQIDEDERALLAELERLLERGSVRRV